MRCHQSFDRNRRCCACVRAAKRREHGASRIARSAICESRRRDHAINGRKINRYRVRAPQAVPAAACSACSMRHTAGNRIVLDLRMTRSMRMGRCHHHRRRFHRQSDTVRQSTEWHRETGAITRKTNYCHRRNSNARSTHHRSVQRDRHRRDVRHCARAGGSCELIANTERNVEITCAAIAGTLRVASATAVTAATSPCESA